MVRSLLIILLFCGSLLGASHPRLQVNDKLLAQIRSLRDANFDHACQFVRGKIYRNKNDGSAGFVPILKLFKDQHQAPIEAYAQEYVSTYGPGYGRWRVELEPVAATKTDYFLNVLKPTLDVVHGTGRAYRVVFSKDSLARPQVSH